MPLCLSKGPQSLRSQWCGGGRGYCPEGKPQVVRLVTTKVRTRAFESAMGHYIHILWSCSHVFPRHVYPVCATQRVWHAPSLCPLPGGSTCFPHSAPHSRAPFSIETERAPQYRIAFPPHSFLLSTYYVSSTEEGDKIKKTWLLP